MKFSDLLRSPKPKPVGEIVRADWDPELGGIRFTILFQPSGRRLSGVCRAGGDSTTGHFVSECDLRKKLPMFKGLKVYESAVGGDPNSMSPEEFEKIRIRIRLSDLSVGYESPSRKPDANTFLSRLFR